MPERNLAYAHGPGTEQSHVGRAVRQSAFKALISYCAKDGRSEQA